MDKAHGVTAQRITARNRLTLPRDHMGSRRLGGFIPRNHAVALTSHWLYQ